jgi:hypothetical protein
LDKALQRVQTTCKDVVNGKDALEKKIMEWTAEKILGADFEAPEAGVQGTISSMLARAERQRIANRLRGEGKDAALRSFLSCGGLKAGNWLLSADKYESTRMHDTEFTIAYALRLGVEPFSDIKPDYKCRLCGKKIGTSATHGSLCTKGATGTDARNERHYAFNAEVKRVLKFLNPVARIRDEPSIVQHFHKQPRDWKKDARRRGDLHVQTPTANYIIDTSIGSAAAESAPPAANNKAGVVAKQLADQKVVHYTSKYVNFKRHEIVPACAEAEGAFDFGFLKFVQHEIDMGHSNTDGVVPKSVIASGVYSRLSVALQRANADGVLNWRYTEYGEALWDGPCDRVIAALDNAPQDLSECDSDLRVAAPVADAVGGENSTGSV